MLWTDYMTIFFFSPVERTGSNSAYTHYQAFIFIVCVSAVFTVTAHRKQYILRTLDVNIHWREQKVLIDHKSTTTLFHLFAWIWHLLFSFGLAEEGFSPSLTASNSVTESFQHDLTSLSLGFYSDSIQLSNSQRIHSPWARAVEPGLFWGPGGGLVRSSEVVSETKSLSS